MEKWQTKESRNMRKASHTVRILNLRDTAELWHRLHTTIANWIIEKLKCLKTIRSDTCPLFLSTVDCRLSPSSLICCMNNALHARQLPARTTRPTPRYPSPAFNCRHRFVNCYIIVWNKFTYLTCCRCCWCWQKTALPTRWHGVWVMSCSPITRPAVHYLHAAFWAIEHLMEIEHYSLLQWVNVSVCVYVGVCGNWVSDYCMINSAPSALGIAWLAAEARWATIRLGLQFDMFQFQLSWRKWAKSFKMGKFQV